MATKRKTRNPVADDCDSAYRVHFLLHVAIDVQASDELQAEKEAAKKLRGGDVAKVRVVGDGDTGWYTPDPDWWPEESPAVPVRVASSLHDD